MKIKEMESPMNTDFLRRRKEMERAASCSKMKGIYIYKGGQGNKNKYREEKKPLPPGKQNAANEKKNLYNQPDG